MDEFVLVALGMLLGFAAYWSFVVFPRRRDYQKRQKATRALQAGDEVVTYGGIIGRLTRLEADAGIAYVEIADGVVVRLLADAIVQPYDAAEGRPPAEPALAREPAENRLAGE